MAKKKPDPKLPQPVEAGEELAWVTTQQLLDELFRRHPHAVFAGYQVRDPENSQFMRHLQGNPLICLGLCDMITFQLQQDMEESLSPAKD